MQCSSAGPGELAIIGGQEPRMEEVPIDALVSGVIV
jgi:hypothetical protein